MTHFSSRSRPGTPIGHIRGNPAGGNREWGRTFRSAPLPRQLSVTAPCNRAPSALPTAHCRSRFPRARDSGTLRPVREPRHRAWPCRPRRSIPHTRRRRSRTRRPAQRVEVRRRAARLRRGLPGERLAIAESRARTCPGAAEQEISPRMRTSSMFQPGYVTAPSVVPILQRSETSGLTVGDRGDVDRAGVTSGFHHRAGGLRPDGDPGEAVRR